VKIDEKNYTEDRNLKLQIINDDNKLTDFSMNDGNFKSNLKDKIK
jgi:hypothetical protein